MRHLGTTTRRGVVIFGLSRSPLKATAGYQNTNASFVRGLIRTCAHRSRCATRRASCTLHASRSHKPVDNKPNFSWVLEVAAEHESHPASGRPILLPGALGNWSMHSWRQHSDSTRVTSTATAHSLRKCCGFALRDCESSGENTPDCTRLANAQKAMFSRGPGMGPAVCGHGTGCPPWDPRSLQNGLGGKVLASSSWRTRP